ncbi:MAG: ribbon-helix-helix protein, CopG family [Desulfovibrio sp.]|nr:MAG: ribbon-helix-helix protein, CopG family [Desulfovibrio sp.]
MSTSTSFRADKEILQSLDEIAREMGRSRNWVLNQAVKDYIERQAWFKRQVAEGIKAADKEEFATDQEMAEIFDKYGA